MPKAVERERSARESVRRVPETGRLEREIGRAMRQILPREIENLRRSVTGPRMVIARKLKQAAREALLGLDSPER